MVMGAGSCGERRETGRAAMSRLLGRKEIERSVT
jgi:hypothetical protein